MSEDPTEREEGQAMETPASIFAGVSDQATLPELKPLNTAILGQRTTRRVKAQAPLEAVEDETEDQDAAATEHSKAEGIDETGDVEKVATQDQAPEPEGSRGKGAGEVRKGPQMYFWTPLTFPPVPKKGDFDIKRLKDSKYFFS